MSEAHSLTPRTPLDDLDDSVQVSEKLEMTPLPKMKIFCLFLVTVFSSILGTMIFSFYSFMVHDLVNATDAEVGYYAGYLPGVYYVMQMIGALVAGVLSDKIGRRPVMLGSIVGPAVFTLLFGFSMNYWWALVMRGLTGLTDVAWAVCKTYAADITDKTNRNYGFSWLGMSSAMGSIVGPLVGGYLSQPAEKFLFAKNIPILVEFPYLLPCLFSTFLGVVSFVLSFIYLEETYKKTEDDYDLIELNEKSRFAGTQETFFEKYKYLIIAGFTYFPATFIFVGFDEVFPLLVMLSVENGGLGWDSEGVANMWLIGGICLIFIQLILFPKFSDRFGLIITTRTGYIGFILICLAFPHVAKFHGETLKFIFIAILFTLRVTVSTFVFTTANILINNAAEESIAGKVNGIVFAIGALLKSIGPTAGANLFAWSATNGLGFPFDLTLVYNFLAFFGITGIIVSFFAKEDPLEEKEQQYSDSINNDLASL